MANYDLRTPIDYEFAQLSAGISSLDTTLTSPGFTNLPSPLSTTQYVPITLADDSAGVYETVWATGHSANSTSVTVVRGREGTSAKAWASGTTYRCAPTTRDALQVVTRATLPADAHLGMRAVLSDESSTVTKTSLGWASTVGGGWTGRKHGWQQTTASLAPATNVQAVGMTPISGNGTVATFSSGNLTLNKAGLWFLAFEANLDAGTTGDETLLVYMQWVNGAFVPKNEINQQSFSRAGFSSSARCWGRVSWFGYVDSTQAAQQIGCWIYQNNAAGTTMTNAAYYLTAEYLGG